MARRDKSLLRLDAVRVEGALIQPDILASAASGAAEGQSPESYGIDRGLNLRDEIGRAYLIAKGLWASFQEGRGAASPDAVHRALANGVMTKVLGFDFPQRRRFSSKSGGDLDLLQAAGRVPVAIAGTEGIDRVEIVATAGAEPVRRSATTLVQGELNSREGALWGVATNGLSWRILRDNESITRPGYIEIDLARIFRDDLYSDFGAFWLIAHRSRFPQEGVAGSDCVLERWRQLGREQGVTARDDLRNGVEKALFHFGRGFLENPANKALVDRLNVEGNARLTKEDFFRQLLRLVYRLIFVMTAEDREILHPDGADDARRTAYANGYATGRLRERSRNRLTWDRHHDAYEGMKAVFLALRDGEPKLGLPALGGLFAKEQTPDLDRAQLANSRFLKGLYNLAWLRRGGALSRINWRDMETEEFGSVYESLLELTPILSDGGHTFSFLGEADEDAVDHSTEKAVGKKARGGAKGNERKTTSSYYTPDSLVQFLLKGALDPVIDRKFAENPGNPEALLTLKVIDPACGSGHFLLAAATRIARRLAELRHAGSPTIGQYRHALRDVARQSLYGVDRNPMAVELTKVALWIETVEPGKPLGFLDANIRCGDALLGLFNLDALRTGIPDEAYKPLAGDDKETARHFAARNRAEKVGQGALEFAGRGNHRLPAPPPLAEAVRDLRALPEDSVEQVTEKQRRISAAANDPSLWRWRVAADLYVAAFLTPKTGGVPANRNTVTIPTTGHVWAELSGQPVYPPLIGRAQDVAGEAWAFHWPLEFPEVFAAGGFDVVLGNPPWDTISPDAKEFFSPYDGQVRFLSPEDQKTRFSELMRLPGLAEAWDRHCYRLYALAKFFKESGRFTLFAEGNLGKGDFNVYRMFVELALRATKPHGRAAQFVPENLYNGANASAIRRFLFDNCRLDRLIGFENTKKIWFDIDTRAKFCLYVAEPHSKTTVFEAAFGINSNEKLTLLAAGLPIEMPVSLVEEFSPDAFALAEVAHPADISISRKLYARLPKFGAELRSAANREYMREIDMGSDREDFGSDASEVPLYEGRMVEAFDYRAKSYVSGRGRSAVWRELDFGSPEKGIAPQWHLSPDRIPAKAETRWQQYRIGFCDVGGVTNARFLMTALIPPEVICGHSVPTILFHPRDDRLSMLWVGCANSFCLDFLARKKAALHMTYTVLDSLPLPRSFEGTLLEVAIAGRALLLSATGQQMAEFWNRTAPVLGLSAVYNGPCEDPRQRQVLRAELDVLVARDFFRLTKDEMRYLLDPSDILGTDCGFEAFGALKRAEMRESSGFFVSRDLILSTWDSLQAPSATRFPAMTTG